MRNSFTLLVDLRTVSWCQTRENAEDLPDKFVAIEDPRGIVLGKLLLNLGGLPDLFDQTTLVSAGRDVELSNMLVLDFSRRLDHPRHIDGWHSPRYS